MKFGTYCKVLCCQQQITNCRYLYKPPRITKPHSKFLLCTAVVRCRCVKVNLCLNWSVRSPGIMIWKPNVSMLIWFPLTRFLTSVILQYVFKILSGYVSGYMARLLWIVARLLSRRPGFTSRSVQMGFMVDGVAVGQVLWVATQIMPPNCSRVL
jgi:hypothetical protein